MIVLDHFLILKIHHPVQIIFFKEVFRISNINDFLIPTPCVSTFQLLTDWFTRKIPCPPSLRVFYVIPITTCGTNTVIQRRGSHKSFKIAPRQRNKKIPPNFQDPVRRRSSSTPKLNSVAVPSRRYKRVTNSVQKLESGRFVDASRHPSRWRGGFARNIDIPDSCISWRRRFECRSYLSWVVGSRWSLRDSRPFIFERFLCLKLLICSLGRQL